MEWIGVVITSNGQKPEPRDTSYTWQASVSSAHLQWLFFLTHTGCSFVSKLFCEICSFSTNNVPAVNRNIWNRQHRMSDNSIHVCCFGFEALGNSISRCGSLKINRRLVRFIIHCFQKGRMLDLMWPELFCHRLLSRVTQSYVSFIARPYCMSSVSCFPCLSSLWLWLQFFTEERKIYGRSPDATDVTFPEFRRRFEWLCACFLLFLF